MMYQFLLLIALQFVTVWVNPNSGNPTYVSWCRSGGDCAETMSWVAKNIEKVAKENQIDPLLLMAFAMTESRLDVHAKSNIGAFGLLQLHPKSKAGREVKRECANLKLEKEECDLLALNIAARELKTWIWECPTLLHAAYSWRTGRCGRRENLRLKGAWSYSERTISLYNELQHKYEQYLIESLETGI
jgi:hypothetical protein